MKRNHYKTVGSVLVKTIRDYYPEILRYPEYVDPCYNEICAKIKEYYLFGFGDTADDMFYWYIIKEELLPLLYKIVDQASANKTTNVD